MRPLLLWRLLHSVDEAKRTCPCFFWHLHRLISSLVLGPTTAWSPSVVPHMPSAAHEEPPRRPELLPPARHRQARRRAGDYGRRGLAAHRGPVPGTPAPSRVGRIPLPSPPPWLCCSSHAYRVSSLFKAMDRDVCRACGSPKHSMGSRESR